MIRFTQFFTRGIVFARENPQIIYTLFLVFAIPLAFFFSSDQFLRVASDNQDKLEQSRISLLEDTLAVFIPDAKNQYDVYSKITQLTKGNETLSEISILLATSTVDGSAYLNYASLDFATATMSYTPDDVEGILLKLARGDQEQSYAMTYSDVNGRHWKSVRGLRSVAGGSVAGYIIVAVSMAQVDAIAEKNIQHAYIILAFIIFGIILLLARQARIIDYSVLYSRLKEVDQMKDDFVSMAAHELRSPLTVIRGYVEMLGDGEGLKESGKEHLHLIDSAAQRLNALVGDILDVAKLQEGRMSFTFTLTDPNEIIESVTLGFMKPAEDKGLILSYEKSNPTQILIDPARLHQVLVNFIGNAVKYTPKGEVRVSGKSEHGLFTVRVSDTGLGISAENQKHLFEKFYRVKNKDTERIEGTGLGLWITARMVKEMNGTIEVESIEGKGSDFILNFPLVS